MGGRCLKHQPTQYRWLTAAIDADLEIIVAGDAYFALFVAVFREFVALDDRGRLSSIGERGGWS